MNAGQSTLEPTPLRPSRILFVDDEPNVLDGLRRMLRPHRHVWFMTFVDSAKAALEVMSKEAFDVIVTDMKMPGMNGAELLTEVRRLHPRAVRIVLSGQCDAELTMRSVGVSHQFMLKPCDAETLKGVVERVCHLERILQDPTLQEILGSVTELPVLPQIYRALRTALAREEVDIHEIGDIVSQDAGIASKVLQLVNSSFFGICREITDLRQATTYLGASTIRDLVLSFSMFQQLETTATLPGFSIESEQRHSLLCAQIARQLLDDKAAAAHASLAAMLHDIGTLVLATKLTPVLRKVMAASVDSELPRHEIERAILGFSHAEIGGYLLGLWGMPYPVVEAVAHHHRPMLVPEQATFGVLGATHVANALARELEGDEAGPSELDEEYLESLGVMDRLPEWRAIAASAFNGPTDSR